jgi:LuxR family maltose regulon positive regulatory protein
VKRHQPNRAFTRVKVRMTVPARGLVGRGRAPRRPPRSLAGPRDELCPASYDVVPGLAGMAAGEVAVAMGAQESRWHEMSVGNEPGSHVMTGHPDRTGGGRLALVAAPRGLPDDASAHQPLLSTKLIAPPANRPTVDRQGLLDRLDGFRGKLTVVVAPAGWGKTTVVRDWRRRPHSSATAWLSLDGSDNDPVRFWSYVIAALQAVAPGCGSAALSSLVAQGTGAADTFLPVLIQALIGLEQETVLVLDDYHAVSNPEIHKAVEFLVHHLPPTLRVVIATRTDPVLPLARLRVRGEVDELRAADLRFTDHEAAALFHDVLGIPVSERDVAGLQSRTEGWAAGLCLAGLSMRTQADPSRYIESFAGDDRQIVDYLITEVVDALAPDVRVFLLRTSVLGRLCSSLCDAVIDGSGSQGVLEEIERSNLFLVPLDNKRQWYRYHHLFADLMRSELHRTDPGLAPTLYHRASGWFAANGFVSEAVDHALAGGDSEGAAELVVANWNICFSEGMVATVQSWLDRLPPEVVAQDARLCLTRGWVARHTGHLDTVEAWIQAAEATTARGPLKDGLSSLESSACLLRAGYRYMVGDLRGGEAPARRALELEGAGAPRWRAHVLVTLGANLMWQGNVNEAYELLTQVVPANQPPANNLAALWAHGCLAAIAAQRGDLDGAALHVGDALELAEVHGLGEYSIGATAVLISAEVARRRGWPDTANAAAERCLDLAQRGGARLETTLAHLMVAAMAGNDVQRARAHLDEARRIIGGCASPGALTALVRDAEERVGRSAPVGSRAPAPQQPLTPRESSVLRLLDSDLSLREIAAELYVSHNTVKSQTRAIYRKLGVATRAEAVARSSGNDL